MFKVPEKWRVTHRNPMASDKSFGNNGLFVFNLSHRSTAYVIASDGEGWEHVSAHILSNNTPRTPTWSEMCKIKNLFWDVEDCAIQYHPSKDEYINNHPYTLHLWRPIDQTVPTPPSYLVGTKDKKKIKFL